MKSTCSIGFFDQELQAISGDDFFVFDQFKTDQCPTKQVDGRVWKDWESVDAIDWKAFLEAVQAAKQDPECPKYIVFEGFLLLATPESRKCFDAVIDVKLSKEECWRRRKLRALKMQHLPPGFSEGDHEAATQFAEENDLAWLRLYFEDMIWPAAREQQLQTESCGLPRLELDAGVPQGQDAWADAHFPTALRFIHEVTQGKSG